MEKPTGTGGGSGAVAWVVGGAVLCAYYGFLFASLALGLYAGVRVLTHAETYPPLVTALVVTAALLAVVTVAVRRWRAIVPPDASQRQADAAFRSELKRLVRKRPAPH